MTTNSDTEFAPDCVSLPTDEAALEFGRFRMLLRQRQLIADGVPVKLGTRALDVLLALMEADGSLVTKEDLLARVWPGIHVSEENLKIQISVLRKALGENRDFIRTEVGRGYRFTAAVKSIALESAFQQAVRRRQRSGQRSRWMSILSLPRCSHRNARLSTEPISRLCKALAFAVGLGLSAFSYAADAAVPGGSGTVQSLYDALLDTMKNGRALGESGRFAQLGARHPQQLRRPINGAFVGRPCLDRAERSAAPGDDRELWSLHLSDLCRPVRQLSRSEA